MASSSATVARRSRLVRRLPDQQIAAKLGHADQTQLSRWKNGLENGSALSKMWAVVDLQPAVMKGLAEHSKHPDVRGRYVVEVA